jgi:YD repeat-containing protein
LLAAACLAGGAQAAQYDYDQLGRLIRSIDGARVTEYVYDAAGNLLQVITGGTATAPAVTAFSPGSIRRNQSLQAQITGSGLNGVSLSSDDPAIVFTGLTVSATSVSFRLLAYKEARLGAHTLSLRNAAGSTSVSFQVQATIDYTFGPVPIAIPPDSSTRSYRIDASAADSQALSLTVSSLNTAIARPGVTAISLAAGATQATGTVIGVAEGVTALRFTSPTLIEAMEVQVGVTSEYAAATVARSRPLGLVKGDPTVPAANTPSQAISAVLGLVKGDPTVPAANTPSTVLMPAIGLVKGDPTAPAANTPSNVLTPAVGVTK